MKYALLKYRDNESNIGDYTQSLAAKRFLPQVDLLVSREHLNEVDEEIAIILNGWFMHNPQNWPPSNKIKPRFVSFHINEHAKEQMTNPESIAYYKKNEPIGCRDKFTVKTLQDKGVSAYFSGCLTLTLEKEKYLKNEKKSIIFCDILTHKDDKNEERNLWKTLRNPHKLIINQYKTNRKRKQAAKKTESLLQKLVPESIRESAVYVSNQNYIANTHEEKFKASENLLAKYASAQLVVTSRIHAALPCLAFGTPVIFIHPNRDNSRFEGIIELFDTFTIEQIENTPKKELQELFMKASRKNKNLHLDLREKLLANFELNPM